jgi:hypothetical protein
VIVKEYNDGVIEWVKVDLGKERSMDNLPVLRSSDSVDPREETVIVNVA